MEIQKSNKERLDELELELRQMDQVNCPLIHRFTPGLYIREIFMPAGSLIVSKIHKTCHPFIVSKGVVHVKINDGEWKRIEAPYSDTTQPGTRRVLYVEEDTIWTTIHRNENDTRDLEELEDIIIEKNDNPLLYPLKKEVISHKEYIPY